MSNVDKNTVDGFGVEWSHFDQSVLSAEEHQRLFDNYFRIFPWGSLPSDAVGFDMGCGSGRWARLVAPKVGKLHCIDASAQALEVARRNLVGEARCEFHCSSVDEMPLDEASMDFGYSLGVLHHVPDTAKAMADCVKLLKPGAPFLVYLYYALDNRPAWFRGLWKVSDAGRRLISRLPAKARLGVCSAIAATVYWPLARLAKAAEAAGFDAAGVPLSFYRNEGFYTMRTDAFDRFGTALEQRFTAGQIRSMMVAAGLESIEFSDREPFWVAVGRRAK